jgi:hypothetical protein
MADPAGGEHPGYLSFHPGLVVGFRQLRQIPGFRHERLSVGAGSRADAYPPAASSLRSRAV